ncbi:MAG TPA: hypothetical protein VGE74_18820 [Gemmata sp.]
MAEIVTAKATGSGWRKHRCQHCNGRFGYKMTRTAEAECPTGPFGLSREKALKQCKREAREALDELLATDVDSVPCPHCGQFQDSMIESMRGKARGGVSKALLIVAAGLTLVAFIVSIEALKSGFALGGVLLAFVTWGLAFGLVGFEVFRALRRRSQASSLDPYKGREFSYWKKRAREMGALMPEELEQARVAESAQNEAPMVETVLNPFTNQIDRTEAKNPFPAKGPPAALPLPEDEPEEAPRPIKARPVLPSPPPEKNPFDFS